MRLPSMAMVERLLSIGVFLAWASGCASLGDDCEFNLNCPEVQNSLQCGKPLYAPACDACLQSSCCQEISDCLNEITCGSYCMFGVLPLGPECTSPGPTKDAFDPAVACMKTKCAEECLLPDLCNPITHNGCPNDGTACEFVFPGNFVCIPPIDTPSSICQACNFTTGPYCGSGLRCDPATLKCGRYCCTDADCGSGHCELDQNLAFGYSTANPGDLVGLCMAMAVGAGPVCDAAPIPSLSGGTCFAGFTPM